MKPLLVVLVVLATVAAVWSQNGYMGGRGGMMGMMGGMMGGSGGMMMGGRGGPTAGGMQSFMTTIHSLLSSHDQVSRTYQHTGNGIKSITESDNPQVAAWIKQHVAEMSSVLDGCAKGACPAMPHAWDPLFAAVYKNAGKIDLKVTELAKGVAVEETGQDAAAAALVQAHAAVVTGFVKFGMHEAMRAHAVPATTSKQAA